jgi:hypothetical protein
MPSVPRDSRVDKWAGWLEERIRPDVITMHWNRAVYREVGEIVRANTSLPPSGFFTFLADTYATTQSVAVRRQSEVDSRAHVRGPERGYRLSGWVVQQVQPPHQGELMGHARTRGAVRLAWCLSRSVGSFRHVAKVASDGPAASARVGAHPECPIRAQTSDIRQPEPSRSYLRREKLLPAHGHFSPLGARPR